MTDGPKHTHYCDDCDVELALLYDDRESEEAPVVCGHCGGTNTKKIIHTSEMGRITSKILPQSDREYSDIPHPKWCQKSENR